MNIDLLFTFIYFFNQTDSKMIVLGWLFALDPMSIMILVIAYTPSIFSFIKLHFPLSNNFNSALRERPTGGWERRERLGSCDKRRRPPETEKWKSETETILIRIWLPLTDIKCWMFLFWIEGCVCLILLDVTFTIPNVGQHLYFFVIVSQCK